MAGRSVFEIKKGLERKGFYDCLCILQRGFLEIYKHKTTLRQDTVLRIPLIALTQTLSCSQWF